MVKWYQSNGHRFGQHQQQWMNSNDQQTRINVNERNVGVKSERNEISRNERNVERNERQT